MDLLTWMMIVIGIAAALDDLRRAAIAHWSTTAAVAPGIPFHFCRKGASGLCASLTGGLLGLGIFSVFYFLGGLVAGGVWLTAGFGSLLGLSLVLFLSLLAAPIDGLMAGASVLLRLGKTAPPPRPTVAFGAWASRPGRS